VGRDMPCNVLSCRTHCSPARVANVHRIDQTEMLAWHTCLSTMEWTQAMKAF
jgi:hypothetical protein